MEKKCKKCGETGDDIHRQRDKYDRFPLGQILGSVDLVSTHEAGDWVEKTRKLDFDRYAREWILGDLSSDRFAWELERPIVWHERVHVKGQLGLWNYDVIV